MSLIHATTESFQQDISQGFTIVDFFSTTCIPCKMFARTVEDLAMEFPFINFVKINISEEPAVGADYNIEAVPTVVFAKNGAELAREVGLMTEAEVLEKIKELYYGEQT